MMRMGHILMNWAKRITVLGLLTFGAVVGWTFLWPETDLSQMAKADVIVCLGGGMSADGTLHTPTRDRVRRCVDLHKAGVAPTLLFTGGRAVPEGPAAGAQMAQLAMVWGVPAGAILSENASQSTLQNALYSLKLINKSDHLVLVTEAFHLPRSWMSFQWAGARNLRLVASDQLRRSPGTDRPQYNMLWREAAAIWFNLARASLYSMAKPFGQEDDAWLY